MNLNEKQIQILEVAERLFAENGFDGTSVRSIAKEANINIAMISYYFGSKEELLKTLLYYRLSDFKMKLETVISSKKGFLEKVDEIVLMTVKRIHRNRKTHKIINIEFSKGNRNIDFENYIKLKKQNHKVIENFVKKGQEAGVFTKTVNIQLIVPTILGTYFHFYYNKKFFQLIHGFKDNTCIDQYVENVLTKHIQQTIKALLTYENQQLNTDNSIKTKAH